jgi:hypothetical protein
MSIELARNAPSLSIDVQGGYLPLPNPGLKNNEWFKRCSASLGSLVCDQKVVLTGPLCAPVSKACGVKKNRDWLSARIRPVIPRKENEKAWHDGRVKLDKKAYRDCAVIEQRVGWLKENRRIGTRCGKLAINSVRCCRWR